LSLKIGEFAARQRVDDFPEPIICRDRLSHSFFILWAQMDRACAAIEMNGQKLSAVPSSWIGSTRTVRLTATS